MLGAEEGRPRRMEQYAARPPARRAYAPERGVIACPPLAGRQSAGGGQAQLFDFAQDREPFDFAQDRESFDLAQDRELVERPVERQMMP